METVDIKIPETLYNALKGHGYQKTDIEREFLEDAVLQLYKKHIITIGKAVSIMGLTIHSFRENLLEKNLPVEYFTEDVYEEDLKAIKSIRL
jgi:predicted HTH domain antitoxin